MEAISTIVVWAVVLLIAGPSFFILAKGLLAKLPLGAISTIALRAATVSGIPVAFGMLYATIQRKKGISEQQIWASTQRFDTDTEGVQACLGQFPDRLFMTGMLVCVVVGLPVLLNHPPVVHHFFLYISPLWALFSAFGTAASSPIRRALSSYYLVGGAIPILMARWLVALLLWVLEIVAGVVILPLYCVILMLATISLFSDTR